MIMTLLAIPAALLVAATALASPTTDKGLAIAQTHCAGCHAVGSTGTSPRAEAPQFRRLYERYPVEMLAEALAEGIMAGHPEIPRVTFEPDEIEAVVAYLKTLEPRAGRASRRSSSGTRPR